jgi:3-dehydrosphinganine reductase
VKPRHAIITGGSSGIGLALAKKLTASGWNLTLIARNPERLNEAAQSLGLQSDRLLLKSADVTNSEAIEEAIDNSIGELGVPELLVTSAGIAHPGHFEELDNQVFQKAMDINYFGTLNTIRAAAPAMRQSGKGHIVMISSGAALVGVYGYSAYSPSKFAVRGLAEVLRSEFKPDGIRVSIVYPPDTDTPQLAQENQTKPAETFAISGNAKTWQADDVAGVVLKGIAKNRFSITPGLEMGLLGRLHSILNPMLHSYFDSLVVKARKRNKQSD